jgi:hypothetical protein
MTSMTSMTPGAVRWFETTEHGPGTNLDALLADGQTTLMELQELKTMGTGSAKMG